MVLTAKEKSMRQIQREVLEFRTPQHPSLGTNNWGGASPLLARNIPTESLEQKYTRLNNTRTRDEIFPADYDEHYHSYSSQISASDYEHGARRSKRGRRSLFKLLFRRKEKTIILGSKKRRLWLPRLDPKNRWPNGWC